MVDDIRKLNRFFGLSATDGGRRVVIVDAADDMNVSAANALLKMLEEPPARTTMLLISHQPSRLLPTIRSRCRTLRLSPLSGPTTCRPRWSRLALICLKTRVCDNGGARAGWLGLLGRRCDC